ncbi:hypothetical protein E8E11_009201 [Didymella keratinophila]|nr:hypothetical protein E8E11_009201 [Didymella keratinophila]
MLLSFHHRREFAFKEDATFLDMTIKCGSDTYGVHKIVVASCAGVFAKALQFPGKEASENLIDLSENEPAIVKLLVQYPYEADYDPVLLPTPALDSSGVAAQIAPHTCNPVIALYVYSNLKSTKASTLKLPPGPKGLPILGNLNDLPKPGKLECHHWAEHKDLYGPISSITVLGQTFIIINDADIAFELMRDRSAIYSSRPGQIFSSMVGWDNATAMMPYSDSWKIHRKTITKCATYQTGFQEQDSRPQHADMQQFLANVLIDLMSLSSAKWWKKDTARRSSHISLYLGGADTTVSAMMTFFLAMMVFPEVQEKAREEIDRVIGGGRLPTNADRERLPYIEAIMKETHRWHQVLPMCVPHTSIQEDVCRGYRIPKGAVLLPNNWWFTHDPEVYPDPMTFRPERYFNSPDHRAESDPRNFIFGYGRRICPGRWVADNALFITIAQTLAVFNIEKPVDEVTGEIVEPEIKFEPGAVSHPLPYKASITPRSEKHAARIRAAEQEYPWEESDAKELESIKC